MKIESMAITPEIAIKILANNIENNRRVSSMIVDKYAKQMRDGAWVDENPNSTICISGDGKLLDGQHRLHAVVKSGKTVKFYVASGVPESMFIIMDAGKPRQASDFVHGQNKTLVASTARQMILIERGCPIVQNTGSTTRKIDPRREEIVARANTDDSIAICSTMAERLRAHFRNTAGIKLNPTATSTFFCLMNELVGFEKVYEFLDECVRKDSLISLRMQTQISKSQVLERRASQQHLVGTISTFFEIWDKGKPIPSRFFPLREYEKFNKRVQDHYKKLRKEAGE